MALDRLTKEKCFQIVDATVESIDIIEIGTGVIKEYGMSIVREMKQQYGGKTILADMKTCDAGKHEALQAFNAGADITTVMAFSGDGTITSMLDEARKSENKIMADLLGVQNRDRIAELSELGVEAVSLHIGKDMQEEKSFTTDLFSLVSGFSFDVAVAGGINLATLPDIVPQGPDIIIVGSAITSSEEPGKVAAEMKAMIFQISEQSDERE